ncbi:acyltransferase [Muriicola soli]|uniref:Acyltransferase n=1 Tax=Muriicola soli TaxID=2507538 RepID=A0A411E833_9FLAO|nr:acyltransferase [Muriicola soli]QBA63881.1 acyltransferase [Muriicola soli]
MQKKKQPFEIDFYTEAELRQFGFKSVGNNVRIAKNCIIVGVEYISIGNNVIIDSFCSIIASKEGELVLGSYIHIGAFCHILVSTGVEIKDFAGLSQGVKVYGKTDDYSGLTLTNPTVPSEFKNVKKGKVVIEEHVIIGANSVILPNVKIEIGTAVGALSLVSVNLDSWTIFVGNPLKRMAPRSKKLLDKKSKFLKN